MNRNELITELQNNVKSWCNDKKLDWKPSARYKRLHADLKRRGKAIDYYSDMYRDMEDNGVALIQDEYANQIVQPLIDAIETDNLFISDTEVQWATSWGITQHADGNNDLTLMIPVLYAPYQFAYMNPLPNYRYRQTSWSQHHIPDPVLFIQGQLHSLAPHKRPTRPFLAMIIDISVNDTIWRAVDPNFEMSYS